MDPSEDDLSTVSTLRKQSVKAWRDFDKAVDSRDKNKIISAKTKVTEIERKYLDHVGNIIDKKFGDGIYSKYSKNFYRQNDWTKQQEINKFLAKYGLL